MDFYDEFTWAVPKAFKNAIASCTFEEGDTLYSTKEAYGKWGDVVDKIEHAIQIHLPTRSTQKKTTDDISSIFKAKWNSLVKIEFVIGGVAFSDEKYLYTTQGRLFTFLRNGDTEILNIKSDNPSVPLLVDSLKTYLNDNRILESIKKNIGCKYDKPNFIIMAYDDTNDLLVNKFRTIVSSVSEFKPDEMDLPIAEFDFLKLHDFRPGLSIKSIIIDSNSPEKIRDTIKKALWPKREAKNATKSFCDVIVKSRSTSANPFKLENHVIFSPYIIKKFGEIRVHSFNHFPVYRYRLHCKKIENKNNIPKSIKNYLNLVFTNCPNHLFMKTEFRVSKINFTIDVEKKHTETHALIDLAKESREFTKFKSRHENLEQFFLDNDRGTIAVELPLWIENEEFKDFSDTFNTNKALTGHIDILRIEADGKIAIWDYKPNAYKETKAHVQVFLYAYMLSVRTGIKLSNFLCGYFDEIDCYYFNPSEVLIERCKKT